MADLVRADGPGMDPLHRLPRTYHRRMVAPNDPSIVPLTADRLADLAALFEQGGDPRWCWCAYFRVRSFDFSSGGKARHRSVMEQAVIDNSTEDRAPGLVAYAGSEAVGWISIGPREDYERLAHSRVLAPVDDAPVWSIVCFVVGRRSRGRGIARALLAAGIDYAREHGATTLEAYPVDVPDGSRVPSANVYRGTLSMFESAGFEVIARRPVPGGAGDRPIVRLALTSASLPGALPFPARRRRGDR